MSQSGVVRGVSLGVDVGKARVGLAAADPDGILATPVATLKRDAKKGFDLRIICKEALERDAKVVYVGHPVNLQGQPTRSTDDAVDYAGRLARRLRREEVTPRCGWWMSASPLSRPIDSSVKQGVPRAATVPSWTRRRRSRSCSRR